MLLWDRCDRNQSERAGRMAELQLVRVLITTTLIVCQSTTVKNSLVSNPIEVTNLLYDNNQTSDSSEYLVYNDYDQIDDDVDYQLVPFDYEEPFLHMISQIRDPRLCSPTVFNQVFEDVTLSVICA